MQSSERKDEHMQAGSSDEPLLRIGELERRTGVAAGTLRAWQRRYALLEPQRSESGYRLFSERDVERVQRVVRLLEEGVSISQAAELVRARPERATAPDPSSGLDPEPLVRALVAFDGGRAQALIDDLTARFSVSSVCVQVLLPALREIGERQARGELGIGHEHFASNLIRGRLWGLTRSWDQGGGDRAVLACAPGDHHDLGLLIFGIALRERGWRITYLGVDTPAQVVQDIAAHLDARAVVVSCTHAPRRPADDAVFRTLAASRLLAIGGRGATTERAAELGATLLEADPVAASAHPSFARP